MDFRQIIRRAFDSVSSALQFIDLSNETLYEDETKSVSVSTTLLRINDFCAYDTKVKRLTIQITAGGPVIFNCATEATAGATEGSKEAVTGDILTIEGERDLERLTMILATSGSTATAKASAFRRG